jgi:hypothetical protein
LPRDRVMIMMKMPKAQPDPELEAQKAASKQQKLDSIREGVTRDTEELIRQFGSRTALAGGTMKAPVLGY